MRAGETEWGGKRTPQLYERRINLVKLSQRGQRGGKGVGKVAKVWHTHVSYTSPAIYWSIFSWKKELPFTQDLTGIHRRVPTRASVWLLQSGLNITVTLILKKTITMNISIKKFKSTLEKRYYTRGSKRNFCIPPNIIHLETACLVQISWKFIQRSGTLVQTSC